MTYLCFDICSAPVMSIRNANGEHVYCCFDKCTEIGHTYIQPIQASRGPTTRHAFKTIDNRQVSVIIKTTNMLISTQKNAHEEIIIVYIVHIRLDNVYITVV